MSDFIDWWMELPVIVRAGVSLVPLAISTFLWFNGVIWIWGWAAGVIMLFLSFAFD